MRCETTICLYRVNLTKFQAYMLYSGGTDRGGHTDSFKTAVIDTLVAEVQNVPGDGECHLLHGFRVPNGFV